MNYHFGIPGFLVWSSHIVIGIFLMWVAYMIIMKNNISIKTGLILFVIGSMAALYHVHLSFYHFNRKEPSPIVEGEKVDEEYVGK